MRPLPPPVFEAGSTRPGAAQASPLRRMLALGRAVTVGLALSLSLALVPAAPASAAPGGSPLMPPIVTGCQPVANSSDALSNLPWSLARLQPERVWPLTRGAGVVVAVIDSGVSNNHPLLKDQVQPGEDKVESDAGAGTCDESANGHGTFVGAIIAASTDPNIPYYGVAPDAKILPIRVLPNEKASTDTTLPGRIGDAIRSAVNKGAKVINLSLTTSKVPEVVSAVQYAVSKDVVLVAASGNETETQHPTIVFPAALDGVIAVAGIDESGKHVESSVAGDYVDVAAPGYAIIGPAATGGGFGKIEKGGTSFAAPYVSGVAALIRSYYPKMSAAEVARRITETADHPPEGKNPQVGYGVVNPYRAITAVLRDPAGNGGQAVTAKAIPDVTGSDDHARERTAAWIAGAGATLALLVLFGAAAMRAGRARGWRPGRRPPLVEDAGGSASGANGRLGIAAPGQAVSITSPASRRGGAGPGGAPAPPARPGAGAVPGRAAPPGAGRPGPPASTARAPGGGPRR